jgi:hypothetical protein
MVKRKKTVVRKRQTTLQPPPPNCTASPPRTNPAPIVFGQDITEAVNNALNYALSQETADRGFYNANALHILNLTIRAESCQYDLDVGKNLWLNKGRWSRLIKEYIVKEKVELFIEQCRGIVLGAAPLGAIPGFTFSDPQRSVIKHRWGGCLIGATFAGGKKLETTLTFYSRTSYIGYMGFMDAAIAHVMARKIIEGTGRSLNDIKFVWHIGSQQMHYFKIIPYMLSQPHLFKQLQFYEQHRDQIPKGQAAWKHIARFYCRICDDYKKYGKQMIEKEPYGPLKRIKRRWMEHMRYSHKLPPPSLPVSQLDFEKATSDPSFELVVNSDRYPGKYFGKNKELVRG